jgi:hypothetical protein
MKNTNGIKLWDLRVVFIFFISPFLGAFLAFFCENKSIRKYILALFMGAAAYLTAPVYDLSRHFTSFNLLEKGLDNPFVTLDIVLPFINHIIIFLHGNFELVRFLFVFVSYVLVISAVELITSHTALRDHKTNNIFFIIAFFCVPLFTIILGLRFGLSVSFCFYGLVLLTMNKRRGIWYMIFSTLTHYSMGIFLIIAIISIKLNEISRRTLFVNKIIIIFASIIFFLFGQTLLLSLIDLVPFENVLISRAKSYLFGVYAGEYLEDRSLGYRASVIISHLSFYPLCFYFFIQKRAVNFITPFVVFSFIYLALISPFFKIQERTLLFMVWPLLIVFISTYNVTGFKSGMKIMLVVTSLFTFLFGNIHSNRRVMYLSDYYSLLYFYPTTFIKRYDYKWVTEKLDHEGRPKDYKGLRLMQ